MAILENDAFRFTATELHAAYAFWQDFFRYEFTYEIENSIEFNVRKSLKAFIDNAIVVEIYDWID